MNKNIAYQVTVTQEVSLVLLNKAPSDLCFISSVFEALAAADINIDMISQSPPQGTASSLSFTIADSDLGKTIEIISQLREVYPQLRSAVSSGNYKVLVSSDQMRDMPGVAYMVFRAVASLHTDIRMITTSEVDISLLITQPDSETVVQAIQEALSKTEE